MHGNMALPCILIKQLLLLALSSKPILYFKLCGTGLLKSFSQVTKDLQTLNLKIDQVMFNSLVLTWKRNFEVTFGIFLVLVSQINVLESYLDIYLF